jgi:hypothetical protein
VSTDLLEEHAYRLLACWFLAELISFTLKMEAICSFETSVDIQRTIWRYIPEDDTLDSNRPSNFIKGRLLISEGG